MLKHAFSFIKPHLIQVKMLIHVDNQLLKCVFKNITEALTWGILLLKSTFCMAFLLAYFALLHYKDQELLHSKGQFNKENIISMITKKGHHCYPSDHFFFAILLPQFEILTPNQLPHRACIHLF